MKKVSASLALLLIFSLVLALGAQAQTIELRHSGYTFEASDYAAAQSEESAAIGGNYFLFDYDSFTDLADGRYAQHKDAVNWWLTCGVTNGGTTWTTFGADDPFYRYELAFFLYRFYSISNDDGQWFYDDVPLNQMGAEVGYKFADATHAVRWSGLMDDYGDIFDPYGCLTLESLLTTVFNVYTYETGQLGEGAPLGEGAQTTMQVNIRRDGDFTVVSEAEAETIVAGIVPANADPQTKIAVASLMENGVYAPEGELFLEKDLKKIDAIALLYECLEGTNAPHGMVEAFLTVNDLSTVIEQDTEITGVDYVLNGGDAGYENGTNMIVIRSGARVTMTDSSFSTFNMSPAFGSYPLNYRWADGGALVVYDPDTVLTLIRPTFNFNSTIHMNGLEPTCGGTIIVKEADYLSDTQTLLCYNGTVIFEDCKNMTNSGRIHSSDFFSGVSVYKNCDVNYDAATGTFTQTGSGFNDEASSTYILDSHYGGSPGSMTGVSYFYMENSSIYAGAFQGTNNTSMLTDVSSYVAVNCDVTFPAGIINLQKESKFLMRFIDCGVIQLDELAEEEEEAAEESASGSSGGISGYDITITGTEFGCYSSLLLQLDGSEFSRPLDVYVAEGCELVIQYSGDTAPVINQDTSACYDIASYLNSSRTFEDVPNTGRIVLQQVDGFDF